GAGGSGGRGGGRGTGGGGPLGSGGGGGGVAGSWGAPARWAASRTGGRRRAMIASILGWARTARSLPARLLHPLRRWQTRRRLGGRPPPRSIVFVCHGNICRSPYAAAAFSREVPPMFRAGVRIDSAGFVGPGRPA